MKLRNKKTGEIKELPDGFFCGDNLKTLTKNWEDYEESKETWYIDCDGEVYEPTRLNQFDLDRMSNIGNLFETKEEAEKAVEKLKAFKRLKDLGFKFEGVRFRNNHNYIEWKLEHKNVLTDDETGKLIEDLHEVFGGNDESNQ